ncbi:hypothetical protein ACSSVV_000057 [Marinobacter sp. MBR-105]|jgi:hypothetical protein
MKRATETHKAMRTERAAFEMGSVGRSGAGFTTRRSYRKFLEKQCGLTRQEAEQVADRMGFTKGVKQ